jgi:hypothetical protein
MLREALEYIVGLRKVDSFAFDGRDYTDHKLHPVMVDLPAPVAVSTLTGFIDAIGLCLDDHNAEDSFIQVLDHLHVELVSQNTDPWNRRTTHVRASGPTENGFRFDFFYEPEAFIIALQCAFEHSVDLPKLVRTCQALTSETVATAEDDGISQVAILKKGAALKETAKITPRVTLAPFRTFRELAQPPSEFLFRLRGRDGQPPMCALFEADGGKWKLDAANKIADYVSSKLLAFKVVQ